MVYIKETLFLVMVALIMVAMKTRLKKGSDNSSLTAPQHTEKPLIPCITSIAHAGTQCKLNLISLN